jgi:hypothetical protein
MQRYWFVRIVLTCTSLGLGLVVCELAAAFRIVDYRLIFGVYGENPLWSPLNQLDAELLFRHRPHLQYHGSQIGGDISFYYEIAEKSRYNFDASYDRTGSRNATDLEQADIAVIGDSFIEAVTVPSDRMLTAQLARLENRTVANLGQLWYGPQQELAVLRRFALPLRPKLVVWAFFAGNDITDFRRYEKTRNEWPELSARIDSWRQRSLVRSIAVALRRLILPAPAKSPAPYGMCPAEGHSKPMYFFYPEYPLSAEDEVTFERVVDVLSEAYRLAADANAQLLVAYVPTTFQVYKEHCRFEPDSGVAGWSNSGLEKRLRMAVSGISKGIIYVDLTPDLKAAAARGELVYFRDDTHWTERGNAVAARTIDRAIRASQALK